MSKVWNLKHLNSKIKEIGKRISEPKNIALIFNYFLLMGVLTLLDQYTKEMLTFWPLDWVEQLEKNNFSEVLHGVGERMVLSRVFALHTFSLGNPNTTLFNFLNMKASTTFLNILSFWAIIFFSIRFIVSPNLKTLAVNAILCAGVLGNTIDRLLFLGVVRDVFMFGWDGTGVWNLADIYIFGSLIAMLLYLIARVIFA